MICTRYDHSQGQRKKGGRQRDGGQAFVAVSGRLEKLGWKHYTLQDARGRGGRGRSVSRGRDREERQTDCKEKDEDEHTTRRNPGLENIDSAKVSTLMQLQWRDRPQEGALPRKDVRRLRGKY